MCYLWNSNVVLKVFIFMGKHGRLQNNKLFKMSGNLYISDTKYKLQHMRLTDSLCDSSPGNVSAIYTGGKCTLTSTGHRSRISLSTEVVFLTATVKRPLMVRETMRWTLWALHIPESRFVEACPARWKQKQHRQIHEHRAEPAHRQLCNSCILLRSTFNNCKSKNERLDMFNALSLSLTHTQTHRHTDTNKVLEGDRMYISC